MFRYSKTLLVVLRRHFQLLPGNSESQMQLYVQPLQRRSSLCYSEADWLLAAQQPLHSVLFVPALEQVVPDGGLQQYVATKAPHQELPIALHCCVSTGRYACAEVYLWKPAHGS